MQATVHRFDDETGSGTVLLADGIEVPFSAEVFEASGLRHLRPGQRVSVEWPGAAMEGTPGTQSTQRPALSRLWIVGIGADEPIR